MLKKMPVDNEECFTQEFNAISVGVLVLDENQMITKVNNALLDFLKASRIDILGKRFGDAFQCKICVLNKKKCGFSAECDQCKLISEIKKVFDLEEKSVKLEFNKSLLSGYIQNDYWFKINISLMAQDNSKNVVITFEDITDQKNKEISIEESRDYYFQMFEDFPSMIWKMDIKGNIIYSNRSWFLFTGKDVQECNSNQWLDLIHPEDRNHYLRLLDVALVNRSAFEIEYRILHKSGQYRWIHAIYSPKYEIDGINVCYTGLGIDITDRKITEENLTRYKMLSEKVDEVILFIEKSSGKIIGANKSATRLYGYSKKELEKLTVFDLRAGEKELVIEQMENSNHKAIIFEALNKKKDGTLIPVEVTFTGTLINGKRVVLSIVRDMSERKNSEKALQDNEEKFRKIFNNSVDAKFVQKFTDQGINSKIIEANETATEMFGYHYDEYLSSEKSIINYVDLELSMESYFHKLNEEGHVSFRASASTKVGILLPVEVFCTLCDINGKKTIITIVRDISDNVKFEKDLKQAKVDAEIANKSKSEFLANMSHEIRTPLNGIVGMVDLMRLSNLTPDHQENIIIVKTCVNALLNVINDILDFSKMEAGKMVIQKTDFDIKALIEHTIKAQLPHAFGKGIELNYAFSATVPQYLIGDSHRIQQILNNLISNAIKFTEHGEIWIKTKKISTEGNHVKVLFEVEDTGIGISDCDLKKIFESFKQVDGSFTRKFGGTGLGLAITKQLVEIMNGEIWVDSKEGVGSKFSIALSFDVGKPPQEESEKNREVYQIDKDYRILLTEDDKVNQIVTARMLKECGYSVDIANNGFEAVEMAGKNAYDVILMDIQMPEMDGIEATKRIRETDQKTPILAVTAYALHGDRERFIKQGMDEYIAKPIKIEELVCAIEKALKKKENNINNIGVSINANGEIVFSEKEIKQEVTYESVKIMALSDAIDMLNVNVANGEFAFFEKQANKIKCLANELDVEDLKTIAFKIELDARRGDFEEAVKKASKIWPIFEVFKKTALELKID
ncbi:PAS domain S-box protein [Acetobacterium paludosum]|uniref:Circadian input-output histidine kinase CikA n=1 Tax=Acetobacterium paludosum TaxID=52693 RepID=A0A923HY71_9FIRM|nr:PAS domain S-box protein [Acetobacterium paludosum]MBC3889787.1 PAS domain S-box protein [Acetobacterium paludosum]